MSSFKILLVLICMLYSLCSQALENVDMVVAQDGTGDFSTITQAIAAVPASASQRTVIYIKQGVYEEKLRIEPDSVTLLGQDRDTTIIRYNQPRENWQNNPDAIGPAVINIEGDDCVIENLTLENTQPRTDIHAFTIYGKGTRTVITQCNVLSQGGDTVSLWNAKEGMYYHANCTFQGAVDFVCPRGWCFVRDSSFHVTRKTAAIWHAGGENQDQKYVLRNCTFDSDFPYELGRHHYEAQFYVLDCRFSETMLDRPIYRVTYEDSSRNQPYNWGERKYFYQCHRTGGDFTWFQNNLDQAPGSPKAQDVTPIWTFSGAWNPESTTPPQIMEANLTDQGLCLTFNECVTIRTPLILTTRSGKTLRAVDKREDMTQVNFICSSPLNGSDLKPDLILTQGHILATQACAQERHVDRFLALPIDWGQCLQQSKDWYTSDQAKAIAHNVILYQHNTGGWDKNIDMARAITPLQTQQIFGDKAVARSTIDNNATTTQLQFLGRVYQATHQTRFKEALLKGIDYLLEAQYPNGGWPQYYPIRPGYYAHITYNDNAMIKVMSLLRQIAETQAPYECVDTPRRERAAQAIERGLDIILRTQVRADSTLTAWCAQHDEVTLAPAKARSYELPSLSGSESVGIVRYLMNLDNPSPAVRTAIHSACAWFEQVKIPNIHLETRRDTSTANGFDRTLVQATNAPALWARFYDITTNQPMFVDRDGRDKQHFNNLSQERRNGYAYLGTWPQKLLTTEYPAWKKKWNEISSD